MSTMRISFLVVSLWATVWWCLPAAGQKPEPATPPGHSRDQSAGADKKDKKDEPKRKKGKGTFTVGKETTYITGPLDKDGYPDYAAALNERLRQGVTPENNAVVLLWKAMGPRPDGVTMPPEFFALLGIPAPSEKGAYFIDLRRYVKEHLKVESGKGQEEIDEQANHGLQRPWTANEHPRLASWLEANEKPLALVVEASKRPHYFSPLVPGKTVKRSSALIGALVPGVQQCRQFADALATRAMLRVAQGAEDAAWQDLLACHRLGRLVGRGATLIEELVGVAVDRVASRADLAFLDRTRPDANRIVKYLRDLQKLPPSFAMADKVDLGERFIFLDYVMMIDRSDIKVLEAIMFLEGLRPDPAKANPLAEWALKGMDWDPTLQSANRFYDRLAAAVSEKDRGVREKRLDGIKDETIALKTKVILLSPEERLGRTLFGTAKDKGRLLGDILIALALSAVRAPQRAADCARQEQDNVTIAFALAWYQREHGRYPKDLDALAPKYLPQVPPDLFSDKALLYRLDKDGYLLYSVGVNGKDDEGRGYEDDPPGDDLGIRMPLPEWQRK
jgi:hypothetical protein